MIKREVVYFGLRNGGNLSGVGVAGPGIYWPQEEGSPIQRQKMDPGRKSFHINLTTTVSKVKQITVSGHLEPLKSHFLYLYKVKTIATITEYSNKTNVFVYQVRPISKFKLVKVWTTYTGRITGIDAVHASR